PVRRDRGVPAARTPLRLGLKLQPASPWQTGHATATPVRAGSGNYTHVMPGLYRDEGVVLRAIKLGEADRIVTIFTQGNGKIRAVDKGIRKTTRKIGDLLARISRVALQCYRGRELDIVTQAEMVESNRVL